MKNYAQAEAYYRSGLNKCSHTILDGIEFDLANNLAQILIALKRFWESLEILKEVVKDLRFNPKVYYRMSVCYKELHNNKLSKLNIEISNDLQSREQGQISEQKHITKNPEFVEMFLEAQKKNFSRKFT
jgi:tetratricopeptide (TPR) repeat protein